MSGGLQYVGSSILAGDCDSPAPGDAADKDSREDAVDDFAAGGMSDDLPTVGPNVAAGAVDARTVSGNTEAEEEDAVDDFAAGGMSDDLLTVGPTVAAGAVDAPTVSGEPEAEEDIVDDFCM